ncbi:MAG: hypothetical protein AMXMBFR66_31120 [Pseudomonadota bacterium]|nr:TIGR04438 family Trp-rich protein [Rubrivivax sp.]NLZ40453.1 TIGR04438 family Trp-rich protein [Comamonadaceae bacterium]
MYALIVGVLLLVAKLADLGPFGAWSWWIVLAPFAIAALWWQFADSSGLTKRREIDKLERRKQERRAQAMEALGLDSHRDRQVRKAREAAERRNEMLTGRNEAKIDRDTDHAAH